MTVRGAPVVRHILKSAWSPSISQSKGRNLLPSFSQALTQVGARRDRSALRSCVLATNSPLLRRYCSLHHSPLDVSASLMASSSENAADHYRLPTDARPKLYDLTIRTDLEKEKFTGFVKIECVQRLSRIVDRRVLVCIPQPRNPEGDQGYHLQCRSRAFVKPSDHCPLIPEHAPCACRNQLRCHHSTRIVDIR